MSTATLPAATPPASTAVITAPETPRSVSTWLTPQSFEAAEKIAGLMAKCGTLPKHLVGQPSDCFRIVVQAAKWGMDPFAVGECTSLVHGRMCYEGKLIHAVLIAMGIISEPLDFTYGDEQAPNALSIVVTGTLRRSGITKSIPGTVAAWRTTSDAWTKDPRMMLAYRGTRVWARLYAPEAIMGVATPDEMDDIRTVEATVLPDPKPAQQRELPAGTPVVQTSAADPQGSVTRAPARPSVPTQESIPTGMTLTVADLDLACRGLHKRFGPPSVKVLKDFCTRLSIARVADCPPEKVLEAFDILKVYQRELEEGPVGK